jgi:hypothetical protein
MKQFRTPEARERHRVGSSIGGLHSADGRRAKRQRGMAAAIAFRESRRCHCGALGWQSCKHRPDGAGM